MNCNFCDLPFTQDVDGAIDHHFTCKRAVERVRVSLEEAENTMRSVLKSFTFQACHSIVKAYFDRKGKSE